MPASSHFRSCQGKHLSGDRSLDREKSALSCDVKFESIDEQFPQAPRCSSHIRKRNQKKDRLKKKQSKGVSSFADTHKKSSKKKSKKKRKDDWISGVATKKWGKYGQIQECDIWRKRQEFHLWLMEVKNKSIEELPHWEEKQLFKDFMEDFNTVTLPHKKYYDLEKWEQRIERKSHKVQSPAFLDDESRRRHEIKRIQEKRAKESLQQEFKQMKESRDKVEAMRRQKYLREQMDNLFKMGHTAEAQRIQETLKPDG
ncbi:hypothetical protein IE077_002761 [Cardiosporidium cionae]|uniref:Uncharacterized protein n=1 Tax=Cardiosporidium cionae TaxID=476202 RepID=A0ABQ7JA49_9APIC|nr:hypothetical protein IE077_002761 [Cardiosporidium cionae]|eukprot:KAF8820830.1 hypothetical protein IE077_002761 [Cardiosporidium cionae]